MRIQELRELSFKLSYLPLVLSDIFFFYASFCRIGRFSFRVLKKVGIRECKVFREKYYPQGWRIFPENRRLDLAFPSNPGITFAPRTEMTA